MIKFNSEDIFLVTGASSGLGESTAKLLNSLGATVVAVARNIENLEAVYAKVENKNNFYVKSFDFSNCEDITKFIKNIVKEYGKLTGIAHFAGVSKLLPIRATSNNDIQDIFKINLFSAYEMVKAMSDKRVCQKSSSILLVSSISSKKSFEGLSAYGCSKGAADSLVISSAIEMSKYGVRINSIVPGHIETNMTKKMSKSQNQEYKEEIINSYPLGEGSVDDVAHLSTFLLSHQAKWITGQNIVIDGGRTLI